MKKLFLFAVAAAAIALSSCASMTTIQTAETLEPLQGNYYLAYVPTTAPLLDTNFDGKADKMNFNTIELGARVGIIEHLDMGIKLFPIGLTYDAKYQFLDAGMFKAAGDFGFGYMSASSSSGSTSSKSTLIDLIPMVPVTVRPFSWFAFTLAPKALIRMSSSEDKNSLGVTTKSSKTSALFGTTAATKFTVTDAGSLVLEYGIFAGAYSMNHFAIAVEKPFGGSKKKKEEPTAAPSPAKGGSEVMPEMAPPAPATPAPAPASSGSLEKSNGGGASF